MKASADSLTSMLAQHGLRQTPVRRGVLRLLTGSPFALTSHELEQALGADTDRITLYRTLKTFEEKGLIHRVIDNTDVIRYAACSDHCSEHAHSDDHVHFKCTQCQHTYCLDHVTIPPVLLPHGFQVESRDYLLAGVCQQCQTEA
ncbi:transcriptional repressor [Hymenobacter sediminis]|uniref:Fur family transcriptional regulator n=1 Tax=Hymenobacter sediminis TaxID=2218621 RepID=UPI000DA67DA8|nr:transcriptional repressor [Hymenobacter sediminis]RPD45848.1 transcriptional repressor [Hymenobacter sediminis]